MVKFFWILLNFSKISESGFSHINPLISHKTTNNKISIYKNFPQLPKVQNIAWQIHSSLQFPFNNECMNLWRNLIYIKAPSSIYAYYIQFCRLQLKFTAMALTRAWGSERRIHYRASWHKSTHTFVMSLNCIPHEHCKASINNHIYFTALFNPLRSFLECTCVCIVMVLSPSITKNKRTDARSRE